MSQGRLETIVTYDSVASAVIAQNTLRANGIKSYISDGEIVTMDWLLSNAIGGIKVQVDESDANEAVKILTNTMEDEGMLVSTRVDEEELTRQALAEKCEDEDDTERPEATPPQEIPRQETITPPTTVAQESRDSYARRFRLAAVFGLVLFPFGFYAIYLSLNALFGEGELTEEGRRNLFVGMFALLFCLPILYVFTMIFGLTLGL